MRPTRDLPTQDKDARAACGVGFIAATKPICHRSIVQDALQMLMNLEHRGGCGSDENTGDGAGILTGIPHDFFAAAARSQGFALPAAGQYGMGLVFMPHDETQSRAILGLLHEIAAAHGCRYLGTGRAPR